MPQNRFNMLCFVAFLAMATAGSSTVLAQTPDFSEPWVDEPTYFDVDATTSPMFAVTGQLLWLGRSTPHDQPLVNGTFSETINGLTFTSTQNLIRMDNLNLATEAGVRFSMLLGPPTGRYFEVTYAGIFDQDAIAQVAPNGASVSDTTFFGLSYSLDASLGDVIQHTASYKSDLHSLEMNIWSDVEAWRIRPFVGLRWIRQTETFELFETQSPDVMGRADFSNNLFGGQFGFATVLWQRANWFHVQALGKAGVYHNSMDMNATFDTAGVTIAALSSDPRSTSCSGEIDITAVWQLTPNFNFHVGYTGLWLSEIGLAGNQNDNFDILTGTGNVDLSGLNYQGGHFGVTVTW